jgi:hypothetical protein
MERGQEWAVRTLKGWGVDARTEQYGTWTSWRRGAAYASLVAPRRKTLEATMLSWSGNTGGAWVEGDVTLLTPYANAEEYRAWLQTVKGKVVLASAPTLSCRMPAQLREFGRDETLAALDAAQREISAAYRGLTQRIPTFYDDVKAAGGLAVFEHNWSRYPGIDKIFGSPRNAALPTFDIGCEDYGMLFRLAANGQGPRVTLSAESEFLGERPVFNVVGMVKGTEKPDEYVVLSAHFDSWEGHSGTTDNGTGSVTMLEAMRLLRTAYPNPKRTILVGLWSGEEQGLNGSRSFSEDHPEVVSGLQLLLNQDNGTGRVVQTSPGILPKVGESLAQYMGALPNEITRWVRLRGPGGIGGGSDHVSFACHGAPAVSLSALSWDYSFTTWHTNRDSYDKLVVDDVQHNAMLVAMLAYMASEDPSRTSRELMDPLPQQGNRPMTVPNCTPGLRDASRYRR